MLTSVLQGLQLPLGPRCPPPSPPWPPLGFVGGEVFHQVRQTVGYSVELVLDGLLAALLGILQERHQQEGDDCGRSVDDELVGVEVADQKVSWAHSTTNSTQKVKKGALLTKSALRPAKRSNNVRALCCRACATPLPSLLTIVHSFFDGISRRV